MSQRQELIEIIVSSINAYLKINKLEWSFDEMGEVIADIIHEAGYRKIPEGYGLLKLEWPVEEDRRED